MIAFDIRVNGQKTCVVGGAQIFSAMVSHVDDGSGQIDFNVTGMKYTDDVERSILWPTPTLNLGDTITIEIIETDSIDPAFS